MVTNSMGLEIYQKYLKLLTSNENLLIGIETIADDYEVESDKIIKLLQQYIDNYVKKPDYAILFDNLRCVEDKNTYLEDLGITPDYLKEHLEEYLRFYKPEISLKNNKRSRVFDNIIKSYEAYLRGPKLGSTLEEVKPITEEFIKSEYGLERFCIKYHLDPNYFSFSKGSYITALKKDPILYKRFIENLELKEKIKYEHIEDDISVILNCIHNLGDEFSAIDLFQLTKFGPHELLSFADEYLPPLELKLFRKHIGIAYRNFATHGNIMNNLRSDALIKTRYMLTIDNEQFETTEEFRSEVVEFLREKDIPINTEIFHIACVRHYKNNLIKNYVR